MILILYLLLELSNGYDRNDPWVMNLDPLTIVQPPPFAKLIDCIHDPLSPPPVFLPGCKGSPERMFPRQQCQNASASRRQACSAPPI